MTHEQAVEMKAPERYVIGDLSSAERDDFEDHFAECSHCMEDVWTVSAFAANAREVFRGRVAQPLGGVKARWLAWFRPPVLVPYFAALAFAAFIGYQSAVVIPSLKAPQSLAHSIILDGATRALAPHAPAGSPLRFQIALAPTPAGGRVWVELNDATGGVLSSGLVKSPPPDEPLDIYFPVKLTPGRYSIVIRAEQSGRRGPELARSPFEVVAQEINNR